MLNTIQAEFLKTRHNRLFIISAILVFVYPLLGALNDLRPGSFSFTLGISSWLAARQDIGLSILLTVLSGLILTLSSQKEYTERTIIGQLTSPVTRNEFLFGKAAVWAAWHMILTLLLFLSSCIGVAVLYPSDLSAGILLKSGLQFLSHSLWILLSLVPLLAAAVLQRELFYPSLLLCLAFTGISTLSNVLPRPLVFVLPWSAARVLGIMRLEGMNLAISLVSVLCCAAVGTALAFFCFRRQKI